MNVLLGTAILASSLSVMGVIGCTEVNNPPPRERDTVIREDRAPDKVDVHVHDNDRKPDVQNNIHVDR